MPSNNALLVPGKARSEGIGTKVMKLASVSQWVTRLSTDRKSHLPKARWQGSRESRVRRRNSGCGTREDRAYRLRLRSPEMCIVAVKPTVCSARKAVIYTLSGGGV
jgi:hypothetical protein